MPTPLTRLDHPEDENAETKPRLSFMQITPQMAERWLKWNIRNRSIRQATVDRYARDMAAGKWHLDGSPIRFARDGLLLDGQHRLAAIVKSDATILTAVAVGLDPSAQSVMDTGRQRTAADMFAIAGTKNATRVAAVARLGVLRERGVAMQSQGDVSHDEIAGWVERNPDVHRAVDFMSPLVRRTEVPPAVGGYAYLTLARIDLFAASGFFVAVADGVGLEAGDPALALARRFREVRRGREHWTREMYLSAIYRAWNYRRQGKSLSGIKVNSPKGGLVPIPEPK